MAGSAGRKARLIRQERGGVKWENRSLAQRDCAVDSINVDERNKFLQGEKLIAVISEAASAGISLHADRSGASLPSSLRQSILGAVIGRFLSLHRIWGAPSLKCLSSERQSQFIVRLFG